MWLFNVVSYDFKYLYNKLTMRYLFLKNVTVVIPTYNSEKTINNTLKSINKYFNKVIIVDANSKDLTIEISKKYKPKIIKSIKGRGSQLLLGAKNVSTDWIFFLHADTIIGKNNIIDIKNFISKDINNYKAASFKIKFNKNNVWSYLLKTIVNIRSKYLKLPYGDQGLLISKNFYKNIGGYKNIPIMEDVEIIRNIGFINIKILNSHVITDAMRFEDQGWLFRPIINLYCLALYFLGFNIDNINKIYLRNKNGKS